MPGEDIIRALWKCRPDVERRPRWASVYMRSLDKIGQPTSITRDVSAKGVRQTPAGNSIEGTAIASAVPHRGSHQRSQQVLVDATGITG